MRKVLLQWWLVVRAVPWSWVCDGSASSDGKIDGGVSLGGDVRGSLSCALSLL